MITKEILGQGVTGVSVSFNLAELTVLKGLQRDIQTKLVKKPKSSKEYIHTPDLLKMVDTLFSKMIPSDIMDLKEANESLFSVKEDDKEDDRLTKVEKNSTLEDGPKVIGKIDLEKYTKPSHSEG